MPDSYRLRSKTLVFTFTAKISFLVVGAFFIVGCTTAQKNVKAHATVGHSEKEEPSKKYRNIFHDPFGHGKITWASNVSEFEHNRKTRFHHVNHGYTKITDEVVYVYGNALARIFYERSHHAQNAHKMGDMVLESVALVTGTNELFRLSQSQLGWVGAGGSMTKIVQRLLHPDNHPQAYYDAATQINEALLKYTEKNLGSDPSPYSLTRNGFALLSQVRQTFDAAYAAVYLDRIPTPATLDELQKSHIADKSIKVVVAEAKVEQEYIKRLIDERRKLVTKLTLESNPIATEWSKLNQKEDKTEKDKARIIELQKAHNLKEDEIKSAKIALADAESQLIDSQKREQSMKVAVASKLTAEIEHLKSFNSTTNDKVEALKAMQ